MKTTEKTSEVKELRKERLEAKKQEWRRKKGRKRLKEIMSV